MIKRVRNKTLWVLLGLVGAVAQAQTLEERVSALEKQNDVLSQELEKSQFGDVLGGGVGESVYGMGPAASKIYGVNQGLSIGGYGETVYNHFEADGKSDQFDNLRAIIYFGYKYNDKWVLNTEIEIEHGSTSKEGSVSSEFAYLDYLASDVVNLRAGLLLVPVGIVNELHEPTTFLGSRRPDVENRIIPTTWRENGIGIFGELAEGLSYKAYLVNGLRGENFSGKGLRGGRQKGSEALADDLAGVLRVDYEPSTGLTLGASYYNGDSGQDLDASANTTIWEGHIDYRSKGAIVQALYTQANVDGVAELNREIAANKADGGMPPADNEIDSIGEDLVGWYLTLGYDVLPALGVNGEASLTPFVRYSEYNTQDSTPAGFKSSGKYDVEVITVGVQYQPIDEIVFKADYQMYDDAGGSGDNQLNLGVGYVF